MADRTILVTGATGQQGGATLRALKGKGFTLRAMTRAPEGDKAKQAASDTGATIVQGDLDDEASLRRAVTGAWAVFAVQNTWEAGVEKEEVQGKRIAQIAHDAGVQHFVYSSVGSAHRRTGIPHFENKWRIEDTVRSLKFPSHVILRPVFFMSNLTSPWFLNGESLVSTLDPATVLQMIAPEDVGKFAARVIVDAASFAGREIDLAGDQATMPQTAKVLGEALRRNINYLRIPLDEVRKNSEDMAIMLDWFDRVGYNVDIPALHKEFGFAPMTLEDWAARQRRK